MAVSRSGSGVNVIEGDISCPIFEQGEETRSYGRGVKTERKREREREGESEGEREREGEEEREREREEEKERRREWVRKTWNEMISDLKL